MSISLSEKDNHIYENVAKFTAVSNRTTNIHLFLTKSLDRPDTPVSKI